MPEREKWSFDWRVRSIIDAVVERNSSGLSALDVDLAKFVSRDWCFRTLEVLANRRQKGIAKITDDYEEQKGKIEISTSKVTGRILNQEKKLFKRFERRQRKLDRLAETMGVKLGRTTSAAEAAVLRLQPHTRNPPCAGRTGVRSIIFFSRADAYR